MYLALTVKVRVLPDPGPAITRDGPSTAAIAALCSGLTFSGVKLSLMNRLCRRPGIRLVNLRTSEFLFSFLLFQCWKHGSQNPIHEPCHGHPFELSQAIEPGYQFFVDLRAIHCSREDFYEMCLAAVMTSAIVTGIVTNLLLESEERGR